MSVVVTCVAITSTFVFHRRPYPPTRSELWIIITTPGAGCCRGLLPCQPPVARSVDPPSRPTDRDRLSPLHPPIKTTRAAAAASAALAEVAAAAAGDVGAPLSLDITNIGLYNGGMSKSILIRLS